MLIEGRREMHNVDKRVDMILHTHSSDTIPPPQTFVSVYNSSAEAAAGAALAEAAALASDMLRAVLLLSDHWSQQANRMSFLFVKKVCRFLPSIPRG